MIKVLLLENKFLGLVCILQSKNCFINMSHYVVDCLYIYTKKKANIRELGKEEQTKDCSNNS